MAVVGNPIIIGGSGGGGGGFTPADEGKVVSNGSLVAQTSLAVTENGTYDTTLNNEVSVSVAGGGGAKNILGGNTAPTSADGSDGDIYIKYTEYSNPPTGYTLLEYLGVESSGAYIDTGVANTANAYFEVDCNWTSAPSNNSGIFGAQISYEYAINAWQGTAFISAGVHANISTPLTRHTLKADASGIYIDSVATGVTPNWSYATGRNYYILANNYNGDVLKASNAKVYSVKLWNGDTLVRDFVPVKRDSDDVLGMYDLVNDVFYTNAGTGSFIAGEELTGTPIDVVYLKVDGSWIILEDGDWDDVNTDGSGGGSTNILTGTTDPSSSQGSNGDIYIKYSDYDDFASGYTALEYIQSSGTQWIDTGVAGNTSNLKIVSDILLTELKGGNGNCLWGANWTIDGYFLVCYQQNLRWHSGGKSVDSTTISSNTWYKITTDKNKLYVGETEYALSSPSGSDASYNVSLLHATNGGSTGYNSSAKLGNTKMYSGDTLLRNFIPAKRNSDDALGMYDTVNNVFYTNAGTDSFSAGNELTGTPIDVVYLIVNGSWIIIEDGEKDDVNTGGSSGGEIQTGTTPPTSSMGSDGDLYKQIFPLASGINFVEYLQSSGTEYINTGITGNQALRTL